MADTPTYSAEQIALAARELREAVGADAQQFNAAQALDMMGEEIRLCRERGFTDAQIADLLTGFDICVTAADVHAHGPKARFVE